jgi:hypothetical protein
MRTLHARFASFAVLIAALLLAAPVHARSDAQGAGASAATSEPATETDDLTTGSIGLTPAEKRQERFEDCMAIWEPATHMTKRQWRRTCNSQFDEFPDL